MAKEFGDKFYDNLKNSVISSNAEEIALGNMSVEEKVRMLSELPLEEIKVAIAGLPLEEQRSIYKGCISVVEANVIKDPRTLENLKKEMLRIDKEIEKKNNQKLVEKGEIVVQEVQEEIAGEEEKNEPDEQKEEYTADNAKQEVLRQSYHDAIVAYYDCRLKTLKHQRENGDLLSSDLDYKKEEALELAMYKARTAYMDISNEDPYEKFRANHDYIDRQAHEPFEKELRQKATRYREIELEIEEIDKGISEINEELDTKDLSERARAERKSRIEELETKRNNLDLEKAEYKEIEGIIEKQRVRTANSKQLQTLRREAVPKEQLKGYDYRRRQRQTAQHNVDVAQKTQYDNIENRIQDREERIKKLEKKLDQTPDSDLETRLNILEDLNKETNMLQADEEQQHNLDMGYEMTEIEMQQETVKATQVAEETQERFEKDTREVREALEQMKKVEGEMVVSEPSVVGVHDKEIEIKTQAAVAAAIIDKPGPEKDNMIENYVQYKVAKCVIEGVEEKVRDPEDPEDAKAMVEYDEKLKQADKELDSVQKSIEQQ